MGFRVWRGGVEDSGFVFLNLKGQGLLGSVSGMFLKLVGVFWDEGLWSWNPVLYIVRCLSAGMDSPG